MSCDLDYAVELSKPSQPYLLPPLMLCFPMPAASQKSESSTVVGMSEHTPGDHETFIQVCSALGCAGTVIVYLATFKMRICISDYLGLATGPCFHYVF